MMLTNKIRTLKRRMLTICHGLGHNTTLAHESAVLS